MAETIDDARNKRSQMISQRAASILRSNSPISSTGSCHGTVVSNNSTSGLFSEIDEDNANGDVWNSTGQFITTSNDRQINSNNIRSTARKYSRWEPRPHNAAPLSTSAIASAFPDFTSAGVTTTEEEIMEEDISLEFARGAQKSQKHAPNTASLRQLPPNFTLNSNSNIHPPHHKIHGTKAVAEAVPRPLMNESFKTSTRTSSKFRTEFQVQNNNEKKQTARQTQLQRPSTLVGTHQANCNNIDERRPTRTLQPHICDDFDNTTYSGDQFMTNLSSNKLDLGVHASNFNKPSFQPKNTRFLDSRQQTSRNDKATPKKESSPSKCHNRTPHNIRRNYSSNSEINTTTKSSTAHAVETQQLDQNTATANPTQTGTSFLLPGYGHTQQTSTVNKGLPVFMAQGRIQNTRLPHDYIDGINVPIDENHIYDMIEIISSKNNKVNDRTGEIHQKTNDRNEERTAMDVGKRSDSGLGESGSDMSAHSSRKVKIELIQTKRLVEELQLKLFESTDQNSKLDAKCQLLEIKINRLESNQDIASRNKNPESPEKSSEDNHLKAEYKQVNHENKLLKREIELLDRENLNLRTKICDILNQSRNQNTTNAETSSEVQKLLDQNEKLITENNSFLSQNKELLAENWARMNENKELIAKIHQLLRERRHYESSIPNPKLSIDEPETSGSKKGTGETSLQAEVSYEKPERTGKSEIYEHRIRELTHENHKIHSKLVRSEKSRRLLKANTDRILESTHEILNETKVSDYTKTVSSRKIRDNTRLSTSRTEDQDKKSTQIQDLENSGAQEYYEMTKDFVAVDETYGESLSVHINNTRTRSNNMANDETFNVSSQSNFSDMLGHGYAEKLRNKAEGLEKIVNRQRTGQSQIIHDEVHKETHAEDTAQSSSTISSEVPASRPLSAMTNEERHPRSKSRRRTISLNERDSTSVSWTSMRRHSVPARRSSFHIDQTKIEKRATNMKGNNEAKDKIHSSSSKNPKLSFHKSCKHQAQNCSICLCNISDKELRKPSNYIKVEKPIPVSNRTHISTPYEDDPTIRPSTSPGRALATVIKGLKEEIEHIALKYNDVHKTYMSHDASLGRKIRKGLSISMKTLHKEMEIKKDQLYALYDVLEGQKQAQQEMTDEFLDLTLTQLGVVIDDTWEGID